MKLTKIPNGGFLMLFLSNFKRIIKFQPKAVTYFTSCWGRFASFTSESKAIIVWRTKSYIRQYDNPKKNVAWRCRALGLNKHFLHTWTSISYFWSRCSWDDTVFDNSSTDSSKVFFNVRHSYMITKQIILIYSCRSQQNEQPRDL